MEFVQPVAGALRAGLTAVLWVCLSVPAAGATIRVPADEASVQKALIMAGAGDTVLVAPGSYRENLVWPATPGIKLLSEAGAEATILDGGDVDQVLGIYTGVDSSTVVRGFTIRGGFAEGY